jgi:transcriptional regulator with XRE-family HTH domain
MNRSAAKKMKQRSAGKPDIELGKRIRLRRVEQKISQAELGDKLGVSFQQVQKYEKGVNRVGAARLQQIASALDVPVTFFYDGDNKSREVESLLFLDSAFSLRLLRAYSKIKDQTVQRQLVSLMVVASRDILIRPRQHRSAAIEEGGALLFDVEHLQRPPVHEPPPRYR